MTHIFLPMASDMHVHLRQGITMLNVAKASAERCCRVLVMPNTDPPLIYGYEAAEYKKRLMDLMPGVDILTTIKLCPGTTPEMIRQARKHGITAVKLYPDGVTTNSENGIHAEMLRKPPMWLLDVIDCMRRCGLVLCLHGVMPGAEVLDAEEEFLEFVDYLLDSFPKLRIVLEHISTKKQVDYVRRASRRPHRRLAATITAHHLYLTLDDIIGSKLRPHNFCQPPAKTRKDREALREAAMGGESYFFLGSDSAPHSKDNKESDCGCAGCYTAPVLVESLIEVFDEHDKLSRLPHFMSTFGNEFYQCEDKDVPMRRYVKSAWKVPKIMDRIVPWRFGEIIGWRYE